MRDKKSIFTNIWEMRPYGYTTPYQLFDAAKNSREFVQKLQLQRKIPVHNGCVNSICWNESGKYLLSGSDDQHLSVVDGFDYSVVAFVYTGHRANIFSAKFLPNRGDSHVISCSGDGIIIYSDLERHETSFSNKFNCHKGTAYEIMTVPNDPNSFLSCGEDKTVRWFDIRTKTSCLKDECKEDILIRCQSPVTSLAVNPLTPYQLAVGCADASVRIFDRRMLFTDPSSVFCASNGFQALQSIFTVPEFTQSKRITSLCYSADGREMLVSYSSDYIYLFDVKDDLGKKPKLLSKSEGSSNDSDSDRGLSFRGHPLMKRLRIRGDWSDTGPNARPESESRVEAEETDNQARSSIVRSMTHLLTRMLTNQSSRSARSSPPPAAASSDVPEPAPELDATEVDQSIEPLVASAESDESQNRKKEKRRDSSADSTESAHKSAKKIDPSLPSTSSTFETERDGTELEQLGPSTSSSTPSCDKKNINQGFSQLDSDSESDDAEYTGNTLNTMTMEEIKARRQHYIREFTDRARSRAMVNLHYSGQSVSSGQITLDVAASSTANERQWMEQNVEDSSDLPENQALESASSLSPGSSDRNETAADRPSSESDNESGLQSIQPNQDLLPLISNMGSINNSNSNSNQADSSEDAEEEVELMMEVDSWDLENNSDEDRPAEMMRSRAGRRRNQRDRIADDFMDSLNDEVQAANDELKKVKAHMQEVNQPRVKKKFTGHRNARTMIKEATFWGDNFIMSGSDCGHIFIWDRYTTELVMIMEADHHVVNCLQPHPFDPILASSGIDYDIKLWAPTREEPFFDQEKAAEIIQRNEVMLEETKDTITVPASFMFRMFTTLNHFRSGRAYRWSRAAREMRAQRDSDSSQR